MKYYKIKYLSGDKIVKAKSMLEVIEKYDLCNRENINTHIVELSGERLAIAVSNEMED